jgi:hypothetical protein
MKLQVFQWGLIGVLILATAYFGFRDNCLDGNPIGFDFKTGSGVDLKVDGAPTSPCLPSTAPGAPKQLPCVVQIRYLTDPAPKCPSQATSDDCKSNGTDRSLPECPKSATCITINASATVQDQDEDGEHPLSTAPGKTQTKIILSPMR